MTARAERAKLVARVDDRAHVAHHCRPVTPALPRRIGRDGLDVARPQRSTGDVELPLDDRRMGDDVAPDVEHDMDAAERVPPVVLRELLVRIAACERRFEERPDRDDLVGTQVLGGEAAQADVGCRHRITAG